MTRIRLHNRKPICINLSKRKKKEKRPASDKVKDHCDLLIICEVIKKAYTTIRPMLNSKKVTRRHLNVTLKWHLHVLFTTEKRIFLQKAHILQLILCIMSTGNFIGKKSLLCISIMLTERAGDQTSNDCIYHSAEWITNTPILKQQSK